MIELKLNADILYLHEEFIFGSNKQKTNRLYQKLQTEISNVRDKEIKIVLNYLFSKIREIIIGDLNILDNIRKEYEILLKKYRFGKSTLKNKNLIALLQLFLKEYEYFYNSSGWNAYEFQKKLGVTICSYCNAQFILNYKSKDGKTRAVLDHFFDKGKYPFLAISIYNLVPCCKVCNSDFKGTKIARLDTHYSPYEEGIIKYIKFRKKILEIEKKDNLDGVTVDYYSTLIGNNNDNFEIEIDTTNAPVKAKNKIEGNIKLFKLKEVYNALHKQHVQDIILKAHIYNYAYRQQLSNTYNIFFNNPQELKNSLMPTILDDNKTMLGKLTREIIEEETKNFMI